MSDDLDKDIAKLMHRMASPAKIDGDDSWSAVEKNGVVHFYDKQGNLCAIAPADAWRNACSNGVDIDLSKWDVDWQ